MIQLQHDAKIHYMSALFSHDVIIAMTQYYYNSHVFSVKTNDKCLLNEESH